jgi:hypothetical protein
MTDANDTMAGLENGLANRDGTFRFTIKLRDGQSLVVLCTQDDAKDAIGFIAGLARYANEARGLGMGTPPQGSDVGLLPATGFGLSLTSSKGPVALILNMGGFALGAEISNSDLLRLADDFARAARTLSAPTDRKN